MADKQGHGLVSKQNRKSRYTLLKIPGFWLVKKKAKLCIIIAVFAGKK
jgi:hypothetical protein